MGEVYEALDLNLDRRVALKFIAPELAADPDSLRRFEREARSAAALTHPHIATLYEFEREGPRPFISMELIGGETLRARIGRGPLPVPEALAIARDVAAALAVAHRRGIVHRDVKPANLMFDQHGAIKVTDFGLARAAKASRLTTTGSTLGTPGYMAPEAIRGEPGPAADVFALGTVLHEMLTGELPFKGDNPLALMYAIANEAPRRPREARPEVPEAVAALVARMLEKDPARRADAKTVAGELASLTGVPVTGVENTAAQMELERVPAAVPVGAKLAARRRRWWPRVVLALVVVVPVGWITLGLVLARRRHAEEREREAVVLNNRGLDAQHQGRIEEARARFEEALERDPKFDVAMVNLAGVYREQGLRASAESLYSVVLGLPQARPMMMALAYFGLAGLDKAAGAWSSAVAHLEQGVAADSSIPSVYVELGLALTHAGRPHDALPVLERAIGRFPGQAALHHDAGLALLALGRPREALARLDRALELDPSFTPARGLRAKARALLGDPAGARADWEAYVAAGPDSIDFASIQATLMSTGVLPHAAQRAAHADNVGYLKVTTTDGEPGVVILGGDRRLDVPAPAVYALKPGTYYIRLAREGHTTFENVVQKKVAARETTTVNFTWKKL